MSDWKQKFATFFKPNDALDFDDESKLDLNKTVNKRNSILISIVVFLLIGIMCFFFINNMNKKSKIGSEFKAKKEIEFGQVVDSQFATEDAQSAEKINSTDIAALKDGYGTLQKVVADLKKDLASSLDDQKSLNSTLALLEKQKANLETELGVLKDSISTPNNSVSVDLSDGSNEFGSSSNGNGFHQQNWNSTDETYIAQNSRPRYVDEPELEKRENTERRYVPALSGAPTASIESFSFVTAKDESFKPTWKNYVTSGTWVTAVMTGGAEANAGVSGESNTSPVTFTTLNDGFLPNGKKSSLKGCTMTGSAHGDISSQRGIVRGDRFSCVRPDGSILDIPVEATVFNFGKNGIRGDAIMRNSKIIQSVGVSSVLSGLGNAASTVSSTNSVSPLGATSTVNAGDVGLNLLGNVGSETGNKLGEYWLKLAEKYHPDIDLRQGAIVNIVFLKGFPLSGDEVEKYSSELEQARQAEKGQGSLVAVASNPLSTMTQAASNAAKNIQGGNHEFK
ncbi:TraB/VirB10 family protein [Vibrio fluvialis]|nr:TraB/VirB10 family protein [Vibrio fluvialis]